MDDIADLRLPVQAPYQRAHTDRKLFGSRRLATLHRDGWRCVQCGMTNAEHYERWGCTLTVDHIDGRGRGNPAPNNAATNLQTLCLKCHGAKDAKRANYAARNTARGERHGCARLTASQVREMREMRASGVRLAALAARFGLSISATQAVCSGKTWKDN